jgi:heme/copper-type cytochrome/quinol oxidase subunit 3
MLFAGLLGAYLNARQVAGGTTAKWLPAGTIMPGIATNVLLLVMIFAVIMASWAVYAVRRGSRTDAYIALGLTALFGLAALNAQVYIWRQMKIGILKPKSETFALFFYSVTGTLFAVVLTGVIFAGVMAFRTAGGRSTPKDAEALSAHTLYWYFLTAATVAVWAVVYVNK